MKKIFTLIQIMRPFNFIITVVSIFVAGLICSGIRIDWVSIMLASMSGGFVGAAGNIINDIYDIEIDRVNKPLRALPSGKLSSKNAFYFYYLLNIIAVMLALNINLLTLLIVVFSEMSIFYYSFMLKKIPLLGNFVVSFFTGLAFVFGGAAVNNISNSLIPALFALMINFIREIVKDIEDLDGDIAQNVITFPAKYGVQLSVKIIMYLTAALILLTIMPVVYNIYGIEYFLSIIIVNVYLIYFIIRISRDNSKNNFKKMSLLLKITMILGLVSIYLGIKGFSF